MTDTTATAGMYRMIARLQAQVDQCQTPDSIIGDSPEIAAMVESMKSMIDTMVKMAEAHSVLWIRVDLLSSRLSRLESRIDTQA